MDICQTRHFWDRHMSDKTFLRWIYVRPDIFEMDICQTRHFEMDICHTRHFSDLTLDIFPGEHGKLWTFVSTDNCHTKHLSHLTYLFHDDCYLLKLDDLFVSNFFPSYLDPFLAHRWEMRTAAVGTLRWQWPIGRRRFPGRFSFIHARFQKNQKCPDLISKQIFFFFLFIQFNQGSSVLVVSIFFNITKIITKLST